jgi:hypothetical protein
MATGRDNPSPVAAIMLDTFSFEFRHYEAAKFGIINRQLIVN